ncbi:MAG: MOSC domain-containing protein [Thermoanaerobaculia bacterium]
MRGPAGRVEAIWIKRSKGGPMDPVYRAQLHAGRGLEGNANQGGHRQVTLIQAERWSDAEAQVGHPVDPRARRANIMIDGLDLVDCRGRTLVIGDGRILVHGETRPCERMEEACTGLREALSTDWRGGVYGEVVVGGAVRVGDPVRWE